MKIVNARIAYLRKDQKEKYAKSRLTQYGIVHNGVAERSEGSTITIAGASPAKAQTGNDLDKVCKGKSAPGWRLRALWRASSPPGLKILCDYPVTEGRESKL